MRGPGEAAGASNNAIGGSLPGSIRERLRLPLIAAPMFLVSTIDLVVAACRNGVIGAFPTVNCRTPEQLGNWLVEIKRRLEAHATRDDRRPAPYCPNLIVHNSNPRLARDLDVILAHRPEMVITSVGSPAAVIPALHDAGVLVFSDVATIRQARKAADAGADGLVLLAAGAGGQTGWINPFSFVRAVRAFYSGVLVLSGGISDGYALAAAMMLGCDLAYMGTRFIATVESAAQDAYKQMLIDSTADDILLTSAVSGLPANILRPSLVRAGIDPDNLPAHGPLNVAQDISIEAVERRPGRWRDIWSAGHSTSGVKAILPVERLIDEVLSEYRETMDEPVGGAPCASPR